MNIKEFIEKRKMSADGKYYYVKTEDKQLLVQPVNASKSFRLPPELNNFKDVAIWSIGPTGKKLILNNLEVTA